MHTCGLLLSAALGASALATANAAAASYDYIVVGGGLSGLVVANRLTEDPSVRVLVLEAGGNPINNTNVLTPGLEATLGGTAVDWNISTTPQPFVQNRSLAYEQGFGVGGGSLVNFMAYSRGAPSVFDEWARTAGDASWGWKSLVSYFNKATQFATPPPALHIARKTALYAAARGPVHVSYPAWQENIASYFLAAFTNKTAGGPALPIIDFNAGESIGAAYHTMSIDPTNATRSSAAVAYWQPAANRPNYHLITGAYVSKIVLENGAAVGVQYIIGNTTHTELAKKEVVLAAGAVQTPKLLMLSGIGPAAHLAAHKIPLAVNLPGVGSNVQDHVFGSIAVEFRSNITTTAQWLNATFFAEVERNYTALHTGELSSDLGGAQAAEAVPKSLLRQWGATYHAGLPADRNHVQYLFDSIFFGPPQTKNIVTFVPVLTAPQSRGTVRLASTDPRAPVLLDPQYLAAPADRQILLWAFKRLRAAINSAALDSVRLGEVAPGANVTRDADILAAIGSGLATIHHICGSAGMGPRSTGGVVDAKLRVYGVRQLRVVDASVFPVIPTTQIQSAVYAVAEKAADLIKSG